MIENIALIKEVHELTPTKKAQDEARKMLDTLGYVEVSLKRLNQCSQLEIFNVMLVRALVTKSSSVIIITPFSIVNNIRDINEFFTNILKIGTTKEILVLDTFANETHYKGNLCHIIK